MSDSERSMSASDDKGSHASSMKGVSAHRVDLQQLNTLENIQLNVENLFTTRREGKLSSI